MLTAAAFVLILISGMLVFNLSYFIVAKLFGYDVTELNLGSGKILTSFTIGRTLLSLRLFPIFASVYFNNQGDITWKSVIFATVGPLAYILFSIAMLIALFMTGYPEVD